MPPDSESPPAAFARLRTHHPRSDVEHGQRWDLDTEAVAATRAHFGGPRASAPVDSLARDASRRSRHDSDEGYVLSLCDLALGEIGVRQHRFDWVLGDPAGGGRRVRLPVDAWYPDANIVVEYRERQHDEPIPIMDRRPTISEVDRGEQRRRYDQLRDRLIPRHGIRLIVIRPADLDADGRARLRRRDPEVDTAKVTTLLEP